MNGERQTQPGIAVLWIIHCVFIATVPVYAAIYTFVLRPQMAGKVTMPNADLLFGVLGVLSLVMVVLALTVDRWLKLPNLEVLPETSARGFFSRVMIKWIVVDAMYESIAIYGLIGIFLGFQPWQCYTLMGVSLLALLMRFTALREVTETYDQLKDNEKL